MNDGEQSIVLYCLTHDQVELIKQCLADYREDWQSRVIPKGDPLTAEAVNRVVSEVDATIAALTIKN